MQIVSTLALGTLISHAIVASVDLLAQLTGERSWDMFSYRIPRKLPRREFRSLRGQEKEKTPHVHRGEYLVTKYPINFSSPISVAWGHHKTNVCETKWIYTCMSYSLRSNIVLKSDDRPFATRRKVIESNSLRLSRKKKKRIDNFNLYFPCKLSAFLDASATYRRVPIRWEHRFYS